MKHRFYYVLFIALLLPFLNQNSIAMTQPRSDAEQSISEIAFIPSTRVANTMQGICTICQETITDDSSLRIFSCGHTFHLLCLYKKTIEIDCLFQQEYLFARKCPICNELNNIEAIAKELDTIFRAELFCRMLKEKPRNTEYAELYSKLCETIPEDIIAYIESTIEKEISEQNRRTITPQNSPRKTPKNCSTACLIS